MKFDTKRSLAQRMPRQEAWSMVYTLEKEYPTINVSPCGQYVYIVWYVCPVTGETLYFVS